MYVTLECDIVKLIEESAQRESVDDIFSEVIDKTRQEAKMTDESVLDIFLNNFNKIARPRGKSLISYFDIGDMREASEDKIIERLKNNSENAIDQAQEVIRQRIDKYGISEPTIQKQGSRRIMLELPGVNNEVEMRQLLQTTARLEFNLVKNNKEIVKTFAKIDKLLSDKAKRAKGLLPDSISAASSTMTQDSSNLANKDSAKSTKDIATKDKKKSKKDNKSEIKDTAKTASADSVKPAADTSDPYAGLSDQEKSKRYYEDHPFTTLFQSYYVTDDGRGGRSQPIAYSLPLEQYPEGEYNFIIPEQTLKKFNNIMARPEIKALIPFDLKIAREAKPDPRVEKQSKQKIYNFYALKREPEITGEYVTEARATFDPNSNQPMVLMGMNSEGADKWGRITGANLKKRIAIVLDDQVYSAPTVQSKILGGSSQITGMANVEEARLLEIVLKAGALKAPVQIIEERVVGPSLGEDSINSGLLASGIALLMVVFFMLIYYVKGGLVANISVILNVILILAILSAFGGTLTLPGISGIILTIGMAVDANVLIFERIREELYKGRSLKSAIDEGFKHALSAILDSNITTFITGLILYFFGTGPIQGFALTLMIGIIATLFTQIVVSRAMIEISLIRGATSYNFGQPKTLNI
ncbi:MAG: protein translocase subunit SecD [Ignavibacteriae bacterium]|nr:protein translocase subunit SecD [Ignavibacteriota bacterium]